MKETLTVKVARIIRDNNFEPYIVDGGPSTYYFCSKVIDNGPDVRGFWARTFGEEHVKKILHVAVEFSPFYNKMYVYNRIHEDLANKIEKLFKLSLKLEVWLSSEEEKILKFKI